MEVNDAICGYLTISTFGREFKNYVWGKHNKITVRDIKQFVEGPVGWAPGTCNHPHDLCCGGLEQTPSAVADCVSRWESVSAKGRLVFQLEI